MNETIDRTASSSTPDDVWGVNRPPVLPTGSASSQPGHATPSQPAAAATSPHLDRGFAALRTAPLRRDTHRGVVGGVASGIARRLNVSPNAVRVAAVVLALFFGVGVGAYLIAWAALPDDHGRTHAERAVRDGHPASLAVVALAALPVLGVAVGVLGGTWPLLLAVAVVALVVTKRKGHLSHPNHG